MNETEEISVVDGPEVDGAPVRSENRIASVDVMRGLALLGILVINIQSFGLPDMAIKIPSIAGGMTGLDLASWWASQLFFFHKCMPIFSMLYGAGLVLMFLRASNRGFSFKRFWIRRSFWLIAIGLLHGYFLWGGDILYSYGVCGLLIYLFRKRSVRSLLIIASVTYLLSVPAIIAGGHYFDMLRTRAAGFEEKIEAGEELDGSESRQLEMWKEMKKEFEPTQEQLEEIYSIHQGGYIGIMNDRAPNLVMMQTTMFLFIVMWRIGGLMLFGMAMMKARVFSAERNSNSAIRIAYPCIGDLA